MTAKERITLAIPNFVIGGDNGDVNLLDEVLHEDFRVSSNGFLGTPGVTNFSKRDYLSKIKDGTFGGLPRKMTIETVDHNETIASVKLRLESSENSFLSYNSLVLDVDNEWRIINNLAVVQRKI